MATFDDHDASELLSAPLGDLIASVGRGVAQAQEDLDHQALETLRALAENTAGYEALRAIGYQPTWYAIPEAEAEIALTLSMRGSDQSRAGPRATRRSLVLRAIPVNAEYTRRFEFDLQAASSLKFRIVPVPPASGTEGMKIAPKLVGLELAEARRVAAEAEIELVVDWRGQDADESRVVAEQQPAAGEVVLGGGSLAVLVEENP